MGNKYSDDYSNAANQLGLAGVGRSATFGGLTGAGKVQQGPPPTVLENLKRQREIEAQSLSHHSKLAYRHGLNVADLDTAIAALEPAPEYDPSSLAHEEQLAPALADPPSAELRSVPGAEDEVRDHIPTVRADWDDEPDEVWTQEQLDQIDTDAQAFVEAIGAPQVSIVDDPELQAAVSRAEATLAAAEPAYVGLQDPELDADYDAMKHAYPVTAHDN